MTYLAAWLYTAVACCIILTVLAVGSQVAANRRVRKVQPSAPEPSMAEWLPAERDLDWSPAHSADMDTALAIAAHTSDACDRIASVTPLPVPLRSVPTQRDGSAS